MNTEVPCRSGGSCASHVWVQLKKGLGLLLFTERLGTWGQDGDLARLNLMTCTDISGAQQTAQDSKTGHVATETVLQST